MNKYKVKFLSQLETKPLQGDYHALLKDLVIKTFRGILQIEAGFITDFMSSDYISFMLPRYSSYTARASCMHDYLYKDQAINGIEVTKYEADQMFYNGMIEDGTSKWKAKLAYYGVKFGAKKVWNYYKEIKQKETK